MTTKLKKPISRQTDGKITIRESGQDRDIIITLEPPGILRFRAWKCRKSYTLPVDACYMMAVRAHVEAERQRRIQERKSKSMGRLNRIRRRRKIQRDQRKIQ